MKRTRRQRSLPGGLSNVLPVLLVACSFLAQDALASSTVLDRQVEFNLPRQAVENALLGFSEQAHVQVLTASTAIPDQQAAAVRGRMPVRAALDSILRHTGLGYSMSRDDTVTIH